KDETTIHYFQPEQFVPHLRRPLPFHLGQKLFFWPNRTQFHHYLQGRQANNVWRQQGNRKSDPFYHKLPSVQLLQPHRKRPHSTQNLSHPKRRHKSLTNTHRLRPKRFEFHHLNPI